jgi:hypothetical protein
MPRELAIRQTNLRKKLIWMLLGGVGGIPIGWLIGHFVYSGEIANLVAGALAGAVIGVMLPGKALGRLGWAVVMGTAGGAIFGWVISPPKQDMALLGAVFGFARVVKIFGRCLTLQVARLACAFGPFLRPVD